MDLLKYFEKVKKLYQCCSFDIGEVKGAHLEYTFGLAAILHCFFPKFPQVET